MLPNRNNSKAFRERKIPNITADVKQKIMRDCVIELPMYNTQAFKIRKN